MGMQPQHEVLPALVRSWRAAWADESLTILFNLGDQSQLPAAQRREIAGRLILQARVLAYGETNLVAVVP